MAITKKGTKWEFQKSLFYFWAFIPVLNFIPFLYMNSKVKKKKWILMGFLGVVLNLLLISGAVLCMRQNPNSYPYFGNVKECPKVEDFMNDEQLKKYIEDFQYAYSVEFENSDEYIKYLRAYDEWYEEEAAWKKTPEIATQIQKYDAYNREQRNLDLMLSIVSPTVYFLFLLVAFLQRPDYLRSLAAQDNSRQLRSRISQDTKTRSNNESAVSGIPSAKSSPSKNTAYETQNVIVASNTKKQTETQSSTVVDINSADEEQIALLPGITIIDAKKAVTYREEKGNFHSKDEFFDLIHAKPHIIVRVEQMIIVGEAKRAEQSNDIGRKRRIDL